MNQREERAAVEHDLEKEKHSLRLMKGRRLSGKPSGELVGQTNADESSSRQVHWTDESDAELDKHEDVQNLKVGIELIPRSLDDRLLGIVG